MTEKELRQNVVSIFEGWIGLKEADGSHMKIVNIYNDHKPLARGYKVKKKDSWCAAAASAAAIVSGLTDIIPTECGCGEQIKLWQKIGRWQEADNYIPQPGDYIYYDWDDSGKGDNTGWPEHVGVVVSVSDNTIKVIEGNKSDAVGYREIQVNGRYIRGYGLPDYASKATEAEVTEEDDKLAVDGKCGPKTITRLQVIFGTTVDSKVSHQPASERDRNPGLKTRGGWEWEENPIKGSQLITAIQKHLGVTQTGHINEETILSMQAWLGTKGDGYISDPSNMVKALQRWANEQ